MKIRKSIALINVASQLGAGRSAKGHGWFARVDGVRGHLEACGFDVAELYTIQEPYDPLMNDAKLRYLDGVLNVINRVMVRVDDCLERGLIPVTIGGDHSLAIGSVAAAARHLRAGDGKPLGLLWVDAHMDMNTRETTPSGNIHGMALAALLGIGQAELCGLGGKAPAVNAEHAAVIGFRFADAAELANLPATGLAIASMRELDRRGLDSVMEEVLPRVAANTGGFHLSLDLDALDPTIAPAINTPFPGGMTFREVRTICDMAAATGTLLSMDVVEHNPEKGDDAAMIPIIGELIACALGASSMPDLPVQQLPGDGYRDRQMI